MGPDGSITVLNNQAAAANSIPNIQTTPNIPVQTLSGKIPIPKMKKPLPPQAQQSPIVLQLGTDGILYTKPNTNSIIGKRCISPPASPLTLFLQY